MTKQNINSLIQQGVRHFQGGHLIAAEDAFNKALQLSPKHPDALHLLGVIYSQQNKKKEAVRLIKKAIKINPKFGAYHRNLGLTLAELGKNNESIQAFRKSLLLDKSDIESHNDLGIIYGRMGRTEEAITELNKAIRKKPNYAEAHNNLGNIFRVLGRLKEAVDSFQKAINIRPIYAEAYSNLGNTLNDLGQPTQAVESYNKAIQLKPDFEEAYTNLCEIYERQNLVSELKITLAQAQDFLPGKSPQLLYRKAQLASREKRLEDARDLLELIDPEKLSLNNRRGCSGLLAKTYDKLGQYSSAFDQFNITNEIAKQSSSGKQHSAQRYFNLISQTLESWSNGPKLEWPARQNPSTPYSLAFLVGFPRSGTTLLDTILRSHPEVCVIEENPMVNCMRKHMGEIATPDLLTGLSDDKIAELREVYIKELHSHAEFDNTHTLIIDKLPLNIIHIGLIHRVFPDSRFILALRHPFDCVLSCFMQNFYLNDAMANFLTLNQSAKMYDSVMRLWIHYKDRLDLKVGTIKYEALIHDLQGTVEPLLNFLGIEWHDNLLNYQQTALSRGKIHTPSYNQVTQSLYTDASGRWINYKDQIKEITPLLEPWAKTFGYSTDL